MRQRQKRETEVRVERRRAKNVLIHGYVGTYRPSAIPIEHCIIKAISNDCFEQFGDEYGGCNPHHCGALMKLIKDRLRQGDLPLSCAFPTKANFQLGTPDAKSANRPSHSTCNFRVTEALLDKSRDQCRICLWFSHGAPKSVVAGSLVRHFASSVYVYWKKWIAPFIERYTGQLNKMAREPMPGPTGAI